MRFSFILFLFLSINSWAQSDTTTLLTKNFKFDDGVFLTFEDFKSNKANLRWDSTFSRVHTNPQKLITLVDTIKTDNEVLTDSIWGFSLGGIPYVNLKTRNKAGLYIFAGLKVRGNISFYSFPEVEKSVEVIKAYNPRTGIPFREGEVVTKKEVEKKFMLSFETGEVKPFDSDNFLDWIKNDKKLVATVQKLTGADKEDKLFKCLLIYDDRNPIYIPVSQ